MKKILIICLLFNTLYASASALDLTDKRLNLYGGVSGNEIFQRESSKVVEEITDWLTKARKMGSLDIAALFELCGTRRACIAHQTNSLYSDLMGRQRLGDPQHGDGVFADTPMDLYPLMAENIRAFILRAIAGQTPGPNKIIPLSDFLGPGVNGRIVYERVHPHQSPIINPLRPVTQKDPILELEKAVNGKTTISHALLTYTLSQFRQHMRRAADRTDVSQDLRMIYIEIFRKFDEKLIPERAVIMLLDAAKLMDPKMPMCLIHPIACSLFSRPYLSEIHELMRSAVMHRGTKPAKMEAIAKFLYHFSVFMPYARGSAAIGEWLLQALCNVHELSLPYQPTFSHADQLAQSSFTFEDFWNIYKVFWGMPIVLKGIDPTAIEGLEWLFKSD